jgi:hypothetical protein
MRLPAKETSTAAVSTRLSRTMTTVRNMRTPLAVAGAYIVATALIYIVAAAYIKSVEDLGAIPKVAWIAFGPALGLGSGHGLEIYFVASLFVVPLAVTSFKSKKPWNIICAFLALASWLVIGWMMT